MCVKLKDSVYNFLRTSLSISLVISLLYSSPYININIFLLYLVFINFLQPLFMCLKIIFVNYIAKTRSQLKHPRKVFEIEMLRLYVQQFLILL